MVQISNALLAVLRTLSKSTLRIRRLISSWLINLVRETKPEFSTPLERKTRVAFLEEVEALFGEALNSAALLRLSNGLHQQLKDALVSNQTCMLPSYNHQLPKGIEKGRFLALDVGGSTFRVALIELLGRENGSEMKVISQASYKITKTIKQLQGVAFFDWLAGKIEDTLSGQVDEGESRLQMGVAWSFPIEQTSLRSGLMQGMGKGFLAAHGLIGQDLGDVIQQACDRKHLHVHLNAIVNDSSATLLSKAYSDPTTKFGLILGTGVNIAVHLPVRSLGEKKFGLRPTSWHDIAKNVLVNTELGMFGKGLLPMTRWDIQLNECHILPDFQPFEHLVSGRYLGEIARLVLVEAIRDAKYFNGIIPPSLEESYTLDTETLANIQSATTADEVIAIFSKKHPTSNAITDADIEFLRLVAENVSSRASAILASAIHALWQLRSDAQGSDDDVDESRHMTISCNGSVIEHYPGFMTSCQKHIDTLVEISGCERGSVVLTGTEDSSLRGAAVAVACIDCE